MTRIALGGWRWLAARGPGVQRRARLLTSLVLSLLVVPTSLARAQTRFVPLSRPGTPARSLMRLEAGAAQATASGLCAEDVGTTFVNVAGALPNDFDAFLVTATPSGVVGLSLDPAGPFTDSVIVFVFTNDQGFGTSDPIFVKGLEGGIATITGDPVIFPPPPPFQVAVFQVVAAGFQALAAPLDTNPNAGGGARIFAGRLAAGGAAANTVQVSAEVVPQLPGVPVTFRAFDVDDPFTDLGPVDPNGLAGDDNRAAVSLDTFSAPTDSAGVATAEFAVSMQPGDNYRIAAGCNAVYLDGVVVDGTGLKDADGAALPTTRAAETDMLTVWRKVHVEVDSMGVVTGNSITGTVLKVKHTSNDEAKLTLDADLEKERFENGAIRIGNVERLVLENNGKRVTVSGDVSDAEVLGQAFTLVDDDDFNDNDQVPSPPTVGVVKVHGDEGEDVFKSDLTLIGDSIDNGACDYSAPNVFGDAYVCPVFDVGDNNNFAPFVVNVEQGAEVAAFVDFNAVSTEADPAFWTVYLLGAYQGTTKLDHDPNKETPEIGRVDAINGQGAAIFTEVIADVRRDPNMTFGFGCSSRATVAHEIGHLFNGRHEDGGMMSNPATCVLPGSFSLETIDKIRDIDHP